MLRGWAVAGSIAALVTGVRPQPAQAEARRCPARPEVARLLKLDGAGWQTACKAEESGPLLLAALSPPAGRDAAPDLIVALGKGGEASKRLAWKVSGDDKRLGDVIKSGEEWSVRVSRTRLGGQNLMKVSLSTKWGGNLLAAYEIVALFREGPDALTLLWSGIGDWEENRFDICLLKARASFKLETAITSEGRGKFERSTRITHRKGPAPVDEVPAQQVQKECVAPPVQRDVFTVVVPPL